MDVEIHTTRDRGAERPPATQVTVRSDAPDRRRIPTEKRELLQETIWSAGLIGSILIVLAVVAQLA